MGGLQQNTFAPCLNYYALHYHCDILFNVQAVEVVDKEKGPLRNCVFGVMLVLRDNAYYINTKLLTDHSSQMECVY